MSKIIAGLLLLFQIGGSAQDREQPVMALLRSWSQSAVYFPLSPCCGSANYKSGARARITTKVYAPAQYGICSEEWGAAFIYTISPHGALRVDRSEDFKVRSSAICESQLRALERDHFGSPRESAERYTETMRMPSLREVFQTAPGPPVDQIESLKLLLKVYSAEFTGRGLQTKVTVGKWVRERSQAYALVRSGSSEETLILDPFARNVRGLILGAVSSPPVHLRVRTAILQHAVFESKLLP